MPLFMSLVQWGDTYLQDGPAPLSFVDTDTGRTLAVRVTPETDAPKKRSADIQIRGLGAARRR